MVIPHDMCLLLSIPSRVLWCSVKDSYGSEKAYKEALDSGDEKPMTPDQLVKSAEEYLKTCKVSDTRDDERHHWHQRLSKRVRAWTRLAPSCAFLRRTRGCDLCFKRTSRPRDAEFFCSSWCGGLCATVQSPLIQWLSLPTG